MKTNSSTTTIGIDLGDKRHSVCVLDAAGKVSAEATISNTREAMARLSKKHPGALVVMEVGMQSPWISRFFSGLGHRVLLANPRKVRATAETFPGMLVLRLAREEDGIGPLPPSFRYVFGTLARCTYRALRPELHFHSYPHGLMKPTVPLSLSLPQPDVERAWQLFGECATGEMENLIHLLDTLAAPTSLQQQEFWAGELDNLLKYGDRFPSMTRRGDEPIEPFGHVGASH